jgi:Tfp pilus assembly protein FimT|tara:strand:+ start:26 stop:580 length:555 start_codon:yes stop_codon:yes gene_type:complete
MGTLFVDNIKHQSSQGSGTMTLGASGETIALASGASQTMAVNTPSFLAYKTSNQTISNTTFTKVTFDAEQLDSDSKYDTSNSRFTPTVAGYYFIGAIWRFDTTTNFGDGRFLLYKNGSSVIQSAINNDDANGMTFSAIIYSDADDYFEMFTRQDSGGNVTINGGSTYLSDSTQAQFFGFKIIGA